MFKTQVLARVGITVLAVCLFFLIRGDLLGQVAIRFQNVRTSWVVEPYLRHTPVPKLQIGAGPNNKKGWLNTDIEVGEGQAYLDASKPFQLPDSSFQYVYSEHVIEHLSLEQGLVMLQESHRILRPGGKVRIATPNLSKFVELFNPAAPQATKDYIAGKLRWHEFPTTPDPSAFILNAELRGWGHQFVYTPAMLRGSLEKVGFREVKEFASGESDDPALAGLEARENWDVREINRFETMVLQATR